MRLQLSLKEEACCYITDVKEKILCIKQSILLHHKFNFSFDNHSHVYISKDASMKLHNIILMS